MKQSYLNCPSTGGAIPAEEYAAALGAAAWPGSGCGQNGCNCGQSGCGCGQEPVSGCSCCGRGDCPGCTRMVCCCQPALPPSPPPTVEEGCCCKQSFRAALSLLCDQQISSLLDFGEAAFITNTYTAGAAVRGSKKPSGAGAPATRAEGDADDTAGGAADAGTTGRPKPPMPPNPNESSDNLGSLSGSFRRFSPCSCDLLDIDAELYTSGGEGCFFTASQVSLCELDAVVLQGAEAGAEGDLSADEVTARNFRCLRQRLAQRLNPCGDSCGQSCCSCASDGRDCCCAAGLLGTLAQNNLSRRVSLVAGLLVLQNVTLLGTVGSVLVLSNDTDNRLYFVCVNSVQFIG